MSWSVSRGGKAADVLTALRQDFASLPPLEQPEQDLKEKAFTLIDAALSSQSAGNAVTVSAYGSASTRPNGTSSQSLSVSISSDFPRT